MDRKKKAASTNRPIPQPNKASPYVPNRVDKSQPKTKSEKAGPPSLPEAITSTKY